MELIRIIVRFDGKLRGVDTVHRQYKTFVIRTNSDLGEFIRKCLRRDVYSDSKIEIVDFDTGKLDALDELTYKPEND